MVFTLGLKGFLRGFIREVAGLVAIIGGIFLASRFSGSFSEMLTALFHMQPSTSTSVAAFLILFASIWVGITFVASLISKAIDMSGMGIADKALGFLVAGGKIFLILSVIVYAFSSIAFLQSRLQSFVENSFMFAPMKVIGGFIMKLKPEELNASSLVKKAKEEAINEALKETNRSLGLRQNER